MNLRAAANEATALAERAEADVAAREALVRTLRARTK